MKTDIVKEGTEGIADTTTTSVDAIGETTANTFTPEKKGERNYLDKTSELHEKFNCNQCEFKTSEKGIFNKHMNSNHVESSYSKAISSFIYRLNLDEFAREYRDYFGWHGFNTREANYVEEMVKHHGSNFIMKNVN